MECGHAKAVSQFVGTLECHRACKVPHLWASKPPHATPRRRFGMEGAVVREAGSMAPEACRLEEQQPTWPTTSWGSTIAHAVTVISGVSVQSSSKRPTKRDARVSTESWELHCRRARAGRAPSARPRSWRRLRESRSNGSLDPIRRRDGRAEASVSRSEISSPGLLMAPQRAWNWCGNPRMRRSPIRWGGSPVAVSPSRVRPPMRAGARPSAGAMRGSGSYGRYEGLLSEQTSNVVSELTPSPEPAR